MQKKKEKEKTRKQIQIKENALEVLVPKTKQIKTSQKGFQRYSQYSLQKCSATCLVPLHIFKISQYQEKKSDDVYSLSITQRLHRRKNTQNALERCRIEIYSQLFTLSWKYNKPAKQIHISNYYAPTRRLRRTDRNVYGSGLINIVFMCKTVITKHAQRQ